VNFALFSEHATGVELCLFFRFNPAKLLIDPYAGAVAGELYWSDEVFGYRLGDPAGDLSRDDRDSAALVPKGVVIDPTFDREGPASFAMAPANYALP
jgi:pullulanase/glycogen debranching enzyme